MEAPAADSLACLPVIAAQQARILAVEEQALEALAELAGKVDAAVAGGAPVDITVADGLAWLADALMAARLEPGRRAAEAVAAAVALIPAPAAPDRPVLRSV